MGGKSAAAAARQISTVVISTVVRMGRIAVIDEGRAPEEGTHAGLPARNGLYARFWNRQSGASIHLEAAQ